jgi:hypothetical protein
MYYGPVGGYQSNMSSIGNMANMGNMNNPPPMPPQQLPSYMDNHYQYQMAPPMQNMQPPPSHPPPQHLPPQSNSISSPPPPPPPPQPAQQQKPVYGYGGLDRRIDYEPPIRPRGRPPKNRDANNAAKANQEAINASKYLQKS